MGLTSAQRLGVVGYGALFTVVLPALLVLWARHTTLVVRWPVPLAAWLGAPLTALGLLLLLAGWHALWRHGGGLPMNAFPPPRFVARGSYALLPHPIYTGAVLLCFGLGVHLQEPVVCWLLAPILALGCVALVLGHEGPALRRRFPDQCLRPWLSLPAADGPLLPRHRIAVLVLVLATWLATYEACLAIGPPADAVDVWLPGEAQWPVWQASWLVYASAYPVVALAPFWARGTAALRDFAGAGLFAIVAHTLAYLLLPLRVPPRAFTPTSWPGECLAFEAAREANGAAAFPSFHATWALLTAVLAVRSFPRLAPLAWAWALAVVASCATTGMHSLLDLVGAAVVVGLALGRARLWHALRLGAQWVANSFRTWRLGPVRVFVHAGYAGTAAALVGATMVRCGAPVGGVLVVCASAVLGAALWAQWVEGAAVSLRPFGYYGSMVGSALAVLGLALAGHEVAVLAGGLCLAAPFAQAIGRLRCLVQGCCHGHPTAAHIGIVCTHPLTRVVRLAGLCGVPIHATQLYSLLWNLLLGVVLWRGVQLGQPPAAVVGLYLIGNGLGRFVEEAYRGEPQTRRLFGLIEYQVYALASIVGGAAASCCPSSWPTSAPTAGDTWLAALAIGAGTAFAMGVDFPDSNRRFARLLK
jgi:prolipoprotein diacylglyceryltransferase